MKGEDVLPEARTIKSRVMYSLFDSFAYRSEHIENSLTVIGVYISNILDFLYKADHLLYCNHLSIIRIPIWIWIPDTVLFEQLFQFFFLIYLFNQVLEFLKINITVSVGIKFIEKPFKRLGINLDVDLL